MPLFRYRWAAGALDRVLANQVAFAAVLYVLDLGTPVFQRHIAANLLQYIAADERGHLLMVTLIETAEDDTYEIMTARYLDPEESAAASMFLTPREDDE